MLIGLAVAEGMVIVGIKSLRSIHLRNGCCRLMDLTHAHTSCLLSHRMRIW